MGESDLRAGTGLSADEDFAKFVQDVKAATTIDLSQYKENQMRRRLTTLRLKHGYTTFSSYFAALMKDKKLMDEFLDRMTINVSEFWRNPNRWHVLKDKYLAEMVRSGARLKLWSAACSTGEEPYTLAMILDSMGALDRVHILATDIDEHALAKAKEGVYQERSVKEVPKEYLHAYFQKDQGLYRVDARLKQSVEFRKHNLLLDPFPDQYDLIVCRNVMIYFTEEAKAVLYRKFAEALKPEGILFVGSTEQIFNPHQYGLESADTFFYRRLRQHV
jgi:chemotaxis protein methyltransferase CheR